MTFMDDHDTSSQPSTRLEMEFWDARQLRSASASWDYDAVSKPQPVNRPASSFEEARQWAWDKHGKNKVNYIPVSEAQDTIDAGACQEGEHSDE